MARGDGIIRRFVTAIFDREAAKKVEGELVESLEIAGKKGADNFLRELRKEFDRKTADLKVQLAKGVIDEKEFRRQADLAAREFNAGLIKGIEGARQAGTITEREYLKLSKSIKRVGDDGVSVFDRLKGAALRFAAGMAAAFSVRAIIDFGRAAVQAAADSERAWTRLASTIDNAGESFTRIERRVREAAQEFARATIHDDDSFADALQRLVVITGDVEASLNNMLLVADVAAQFFEGDLARAADVVGRAMLGDTEQLRRLGIETKSAHEALTILAERSMGAASREAGTFAGKVAQLRNEWGEFKETIGNTLTQGEGGTGALDVLLATLRSINQALEQNAGSVRTIGSLIKWLGTEVIARTLSFAFLPLFTLITGLANAYGLAARGARLLGQAVGADTAAIDAHIKKVDELTRSVAELTKATARTMVFGAEIPDAPGATGAPPITRTPPIVAEGAKDAADAHEEAAKKTEEVWTKAMETVGKEVEAQKGVFEELADAWAQGGFAAIVAYAKGKVKENLAAAIEMSAKALGALFFGNFGAAAAAAKSAAMHGAAAAAWGQLAKSGGGSGGNGGGSAPAGAGPSGVDRGSGARTPGTEVHIYIDPLSPHDPRYQDIHAETERIVRERHGDNASVTWHPRRGAA